jgi:tRNA-modifying protein YgfZ
MMPTTEFLQHHAALTGGAGCALLDRALLEIRGRDRIALLHAFCTNDVKKLAPGQGCEAFITGPQGKTLGHVLILCEAERLLLDTTAGQAAVLVAHLDKYVISEDVEFADVSAGWRDVLVAGAAAEGLLRELSGAEPPAELLEHCAGQIAGHDTAICRVEYAGPRSYFLRTPAASAEAVLAALASSGAARCDDAAVEASRLEAGFPLFGHDITPDNLPQEVGRDQRAISFTKGCYLGQETVARIDALGHVNRLLVGLKFAGPDIPPAGTPLYSGDKPVGEVTSAAWSPRMNAPLAMGYVRRLLAKPGTALESDCGPAEAIALPLE